ncbi:MAG: acyl-ACP desaturase [Gemmatimonadales bacterium]|nr:acyl-ACP desaturase [Gemmatimonadota bacterium]MBP6668031.1 acyl-ACP desaturase [Gemmatimonadales bacterium]MBK7351183.1 acyl-ACP desaturase [Gemmatimonadota bacterium]MBK7786343.1 acyl-ACP desaturase [Gemmatimonadota bacterium]MBK9065729.1 acyl-ACP desaturase [Gemmatimonadota bacterium]
MALTDGARAFLTKIEVLRDLESKVRELMETHEQKRPLWFPSELLGPPPGADPDRHVANLRSRAAGIPDSARAALALNMLTEEGLPHFHRLLAVYLGDDSHWRDWNNLWTAEEDRHGVILHDYIRDTRLVDQRRLEEMQFSYLKSGFQPDWDKDPYRVFAYTTLQERATQQSHSETGRLIGEYEPLLAEVLTNVATEEARHFSFYRTIFEEILQRDPDQALISAAHIMPSIEMPGHTMPGFRDLADVIRRAGIYGPRDYLRIVQEQIRYWRLETLTGLNDLGRKAQEKILGIPARLTRIAEHIESKSRAKTFSFEVVFNREFAME